MVHDTCLALNIYMALVSNGLILDWNFCANIAPPFIFQDDLSDRKIHSAIFWLQCLLLLPLMLE